MMNKDTNVDECEVEIATQIFHIRHRHKEIKMFEKLSP
jgi:hypothetical protein